MKRIHYIVGGSGLVIVLLMLAYILYAPFFSRFLPGHEQRVIMKVGSELIYQKDLDIELANFPQEARQERKDEILQKMANDSILLQAAEKEGLLTLTDSIFNSPQKAYYERIQRITDVQEQIDKNRDTLKGSVIAIWFTNSKIGFTKGKALAYKKIVQLYDNVKSKSMTMEQAAQQIKTDTDLASLDPAYQANAIFYFNTQPHEAIVYDKAFTAEIKKLQPGQVSQLVLVKDKERVNGELTGKMVDAVYMFAQLTDKKVTGTHPGFEQWFEIQKRNYEIIYY